MTEQKPVTTEIFGSLLLSETTLVERVANGTLVLAGEENLIPTAEVTVGGNIYRAGQLAPSLELALKLPLSAACPNMVDLFAEITSTLTGFAGVAGEEAPLLAAAVLASWVSDALPLPLHIAIVGIGGLTRLKSVLASLVRYPLVLADVRAIELGTLPAGIEPTLLVSQPSPRTLRQLAMTQERGNFHLKAGNLLAVPHCTCFTFSSAPIDRAALTVNVTQANSRPVAKFQLEQLESTLRPQLLGFRLARWGAVALAQFDSPELTSEVRAAAQCLGRTLEGHPDAQQSVVHALRAEEERRRTDLQESDAGVTLQALFTLAHDEESDRSVQAITKVANALAAAEGHRFSERAIGSILREQLGFCTQRHAAGYRVLLSRTAGERLHRMALEFRLTAPLFPREGCDLCVAMKTDSDLNDLHDVHEVHSAPFPESAVSPVESPSRPEEEGL